MDLRTRLVLALVAASLAGMLALGAVAYRMSEDLLTERTVRQLEALVEAKERELESLVRGWYDRVWLIASRTQLRRSTDAFVRSGDPAERDRIQQIVADAADATRSVHSVTVYDPSGRPLVWGEGAEAPAPLPDSVVGLVGDSVLYRGVEPGGDGPPTVRFLAPMVLDGRRVGLLGASVEALDLIGLTRDTTGLESTGETMIASLDRDGRPRVLNPVRHPPGGPGAAVDVSGPRDPVRVALDGREGTFTEGLVDYRGETVWAATRFVPELGWGLAVKFDADEEMASVVRLRDWLLGAGISLSAIAILVGTLLALKIARPIRALADVANRIRMGDLSARAEVAGEDELGVLAMTFNEMSAELQRRLVLLEEHKRFFDLSPDMLCIAATDGYYKRVNPAFERVLGWSAEELLARPIVDFVHPDDVAKTGAEIQRLARGIPTVSFENRWSHAGGGWVRLRWVCHPDTETGLLYAIARPVREG